MSLKFPKNTAMLICLHIIYGCFSAEIVELNDCNIDDMVHKA